MQLAGYIYDHTYNVIRSWRCDTHENAPHCWRQFLTVNYGTFITIEIGLQYNPKVSQGG